MVNIQIFNYFSRLFVTVVRLLYKCSGDSLSSKHSKIITRNAKHNIYLRDDSISYPAFANQNGLKFRRIRRFTNLAKWLVRLIIHPVGLA